MKKFDEAEVRRVASQLGIEDTKWVPSGSGILQPVMIERNQESFVQGARYQHFIDLVEYHKLEEEVIALRKFKDDMIRIAGDSFLRPGVK